jgi:aldehyde dehydrogenase (NAD+)
MEESIQYIINSQREFFYSNASKDVHFRKKQLKKLYKVLQQNEELIFEAVYQDLKKSKFEFFETELGLIYSEINLVISHLKQWSQKKYVATNFVNFPASSYIIPEPLGNTLIIGAWNYPFLLCIHPLISAIAAGNTAIVKPSEMASNSSSAIAAILNKNFNPEYVFVKEGGVSESTELLDYKFDKIFYTGSTSVGRIIYQAAAKHLTPVTLELGGKSPCFVLKDAPIKLTAQRIVWGKFTNSGQTCVAPDYLLIDSKIKDQLLEEIQKQIIQIHGDQPIESNTLSKIINPHHFQRLSKLLDPNKIIFGGETNASQQLIAPTIMHPIDFNHEIMKDEIFGPILPIIEFDNLDNAIQQVKRRPKPLALYVFTNNQKDKNHILQEISFGGGAINEVLTHLANHNLPFGGVGSSGMGHYHGKFGFDNFSHHKSILEKPTWFEPSFKYPPYSNWKFRLLKKLF